MFGDAPAEDEPIFIKHCYSALTNPDVVPHLRGRGFETQVFAGAQTNVSIVSTLRDASNAGYNVIMAKDCVA